MDEFNHPYKLAGDQFHLVLGYCIAKWAEVEEQLFRICWTALQCPMKQAAIVYFRTPTLGARLTLAHELVVSVLPKPERMSGGHPHEHVKTWNKLEADTRELLITRARLAHHPVFGIGAPVQVQEDSGGFSEIYDTSWFETYVSEAEQATGKHEKLVPLRQVDLERHFPEIGDISRRMDSFFRSALLPQFPLLAEPPPK